jgi:hypothetical protein
LADTPLSTVPEYAVPQHGSYAVPSLASGSPYTDEFGWGPGQKIGHASTTEVPSIQRTNVSALLTFRNPPDQAPEIWYGRRDADDKTRHSVEHQDADGWEELKGVTANDRRWAPNPRSTPQPETRRTQHMSPATYSFTRPFDTGYARTLNGNHFSMAAHRRDYPVLGMAPIVRPRNTFRATPIPWDIDVVDVPQESTAPDIPYGRMVSPELPLNRRWRL